MKYYHNTLYPFQDRVLVDFRDAPFYLTGGTALSRGYYNHRYSEDLDFFVNDHPDFSRLVARQIDLLGQSVKNVNVQIRDTHFCRVFIGAEQMKVEMVNDVPSHIGSLADHPQLGKLDSKENILANKLTAIVDRTLPKDMADVYFLLKDGLNIKVALTNAKSKAAGISPLLIARIFARFDYGLMDKEIKWVRKVPHQDIEAYLKNISSAIIRGRC